MVDFATSLQTLVEETHRPNPVDIDHATIALIRAMNFLKARPYWFNEETSVDLATLGIQEYVIPTTPQAGGIPFDLLRIRVTQIRVGQNWYDPMEQVDIQVIRHLTFFEGNTGYPYLFAIHNQTVYIYTIPNQNFEWRIDYTQDLDRPRYRWDGSSYIFEERVSGTTFKELTPSYTNGWLEHAEELVRARATVELYQLYYKNPENLALAIDNFEVEDSRHRAEDNFFQEGNMRQEVSAL